MNPAIQAVPDGSPIKRGFVWMSACMAWISKLCPNSLTALIGIGAPLRTEAIPQDRAATATASRLLDEDYELHLLVITQGNILSDVETGQNIRHFAVLENKRFVCPPRLSRAHFHYSLNDLFDSPV